ncbi:MAG: putative sugar nucleotidyl transferase [Schleiferiaceae bacterium]|nr:putative sugar nucleotidyl transferase [Schleiferiaceae bacterium]
MDLVFHDGPEHATLKPLTWTRPVADLRIGILTISEKWSRRLASTTFSFSTQAHLSAKFPLRGGELHLRGGLLPNEAIVQAVNSLKDGQRLMAGQEWLAHRNGDDVVNFDASFQILQFPEQIFAWNGSELEADYTLLTAGRTSQAISLTNTVIGERIFLEPGAKVEACILNSTTGPIYLASDSEIMEGSIVRGGFALGVQSQLKLGTKIYGPTTVGPHSKVGGEVNNSVIWGYSNKGHDGFLGNSVLGQWCNIGADSNNSNLKNNYDEVKRWSYVSKRFERTGMQFCGLIMGDHSKCGINTMFNTGTVVGVNCNIYGAGFPRNFVADFSWGGPQGISEYSMVKALATASRVMERRGVALDAVESDILSAIFAQTAEFRGGTALAD